MGTCGPVSHPGQESRVLREAVGWGCGAGWVLRPTTDLLTGRPTDTDTNTGGRAHFLEAAQEACSLCPMGFPELMGTPTTNTPSSLWDRQEGGCSLDNASLRE